MRRTLIFSLVTATPLVILATWFLLWSHTPTFDLSASAINPTAQELTKPTETSDDIQPATTTEVIAPTQATNEVTASNEVTGEVTALHKITATQRVETTATPKPPTETAPAIKEVPRQTPPTPTHLDDLLHSLTNATRAKNNRSELSFDTSLSSLAKERSEEMIRDNYFSHTSLDGCNLQCRLSNSGYETLSWGENLAESTSYQMLSNAELADMFMQSWLKSSSHRDNLLSQKFTRQGIAVAQKGGRIVVTVIFSAS